ncbi:Pkinase-domain-containing protein [Rhizopus microsporus var. microsporus]|uniref:Pkinase-domain-containing protein n=2 Tax=Rhizopus microsporus TaxID=58291 RepID=A0A2G4SNT1_RHIZD|nr:Pkinase-domain-containing protein [Rhizopus microsporus ATCC 52813]ORE03953.1 Pkinase-domain-containing protein [Rhizopus microsporus var. microsporus]PHZ10420.1 Pkinase-domain-containing protein [Rhizopus microsporus ATCC 52813]
MPSRSNSILHIGNFGDYHLLQDLGQGACGKVKLAMNNETGETLAIKIIKRPEIDEEQRSINGKVYSEKKFLEEKLNWEGREKRAVRETSIMKLLRHPYVVKYYDMVTTDSYHYIMMEYAEGGQLLHHIAADGMMCEPEARHYTRQIISALDYMHRNSIVHRDLKVENIMLDRTGRSIKVGDFGLSNTHFPEKRLTTFCGSLYFAAPEVLNGDPYQGPELDVWSLGVVIYVMVTGHMPFDDVSVPLIQDKIKNAIVSYPEHISECLQDLLSKIFVVDQKRRIKLADIMKHDWIEKHYAQGIKNYVPIRIPLHIPLASPILNEMSEYFNFGTPEEIRTKMETIIESPLYKFASDHCCCVELCRLNKINEDQLAFIKRWGFYNDPQSVPAAFHPLLSVYYLIRERLKNQVVPFVPDSPRSVHLSSVCNSPVDGDTPSDQRCSWLKLSTEEMNIEKEYSKPTESRLISASSSETYATAQGLSREHDQVAQSHIHEEDHHHGIKHIVASLNAIFSKISCQPPPP